MQILEPSRPIPKCEHFHVDICAQKQALGNVHVIAYMCVCACVNSVCARACLHVSVYCMRV